MTTTTLIDALDAARAVYQGEYEAALDQAIAGTLPAPDPWRGGPIVVGMLRARCDDTLWDHVRAHWPAGTHIRDVYGYRDNERSTSVHDPEGVREYARRMARGCCGSIDVRIGDHLYGFNYGH